MMIVVCEVVEETINSFELTFYEPIVVMLLASFWQAKPHPTHSYQMRNIRIHHYEVSDIPIVALTGAIVSQLHYLVKAVLIELSVRILVVAYKHFI